MEVTFMSCIIRPVLKNTEFKDKNTILFAAEELQKESTDFEKLIDEAL